MERPKTEGEVYDRLKALVAECDVLRDVVDERTGSFLKSAGLNANAALDNWMSEA